MFSLSCSFSAQEKLPFDSLKLREVKDFFADDYGNIYLYKNKDFSFVKYDSVGKQLGKMMLTVPFKTQSVQNPLNIVLFSENAQELKMIDQNLNEIQKIDLWKFGFVKMVYAEDLQQIWILDGSMKRLVQYNFRNDLLINSYPFDIDFDEVKDLLVFNNKVYFLMGNTFSVYNFKAEKLFEQIVENPRKLRRENESILIIEDKKITEFTFPESIKEIFVSEESKIVDKNSTSFFELKENKFYLYPIKN